MDRFLAKNTSEDNASFEQIMDLAKDKEKLKHAWLYEAETEFKQVCIQQFCGPTNLEKKLLFYDDLYFIATSRKLGFTSPREGSTGVCESWTGNLGV